MEYMDYDYRDQDIAADNMYRTEQPPEWDGVGNGLDAFKGVIRMGNVIQEQENSSNHLDKKGDQGNEPQRTEKPGASWKNVSSEKLGYQLIKPNSNLNPSCYVSPHTYPLTL
jgi:hypothetical protein